MIAGTLILETTIINFVQIRDVHALNMSVNISDTENGEIEDLIIPQDKFLKALAIAVHNDGMPDHKLDYPDAESVMGKIRWIP